MIAKLYLFIRQFIRHTILHIDDRSMLEIAISNGLKIGKNHNIQVGCIIDPSHCWLIEIGDNVTLAPRVHILAHDASTKRVLGYTRLGQVKIGSNVFIGANSIVLPGVTIGSNVIIGAGSIITKDIPNNVVACGNPCIVKGDYKDYMERKQKEIDLVPCYDESFTINRITPQKRTEMIQNCSTSKYSYII